MYYLEKKEIAKEDIEKLTIGNTIGFFDVIKDINIYLNNPKDKQALKETKKVIKEHNQNIDNSSLFNMLFQRKDDINYELEKISKTYTL